MSAAGKKDPFTIVHKGPIAYFELDTPGSDVNIFTREAACQVVEEINRLDPDGTRIIVFTSRKPYSFINGTQLTLASSIKGFDDIQELTRPTRLAYKAIENAPFLTVAAVEGCCYGCGVEFTVHCDFRVISASSDSRFYMTELPDYHFPPIFGGMYKIPERIGFKNAIEFIIGGQTWHGRKAGEKGLVDRVLRFDQFDDDLQEFLESLLQSDFKKRATNAGNETNKNEENERIYQNALAMIEKLPLPKHHLYKGSLSILFDIVRSGLNEQKTTAAVAELFSSLPNRTWRNATRLFFFQTMARTAALRTSSLVPSKEVWLEVEETAPGGAALFSNSQLRHLRIDYKKLDPSDQQPIDFQLFDPDASERYPFKIQWGFQEKPHQPDRFSLYFPETGHKTICEAALPEKPTEPFRSFLQLLHHSGRETIVITPDQTSVLNRFIITYGNVLAQLSETIQDQTELGFTMWSFGLEKTVSDIDRLTEDARFHGAKNNFKADFGLNYNPNLLKKLFTAMYHLGLDCVAEKLLQHTSQVDMIMKFLFGFPVSAGSFCEFMKSDRLSNYPFPNHRETRENRNHPFN